MVSLTAVGDGGPGVEGLSHPMAHKLAHHTVTVLVGKRTEEEREW